MNLVDFVNLLRISGTDCKIAPGHVDGSLRSAGRHYVHDVHRRGEDRLRGKDYNPVAASHLVRTTAEEHQRDHPSDGDGPTDSGEAKDLPVI
jgi:hypothetical protein